MPQQPLVKNYFTFVRGLITEANALTFPENASFDEENFVLHRDGSRRRRQGIDYEQGYALSEDIDKDYFSERAISTHLWKSVSGDGFFNMLLVQVGPIVYFYDYDQSELSEDGYPYQLDLSEFALPSASNIGSEPIVVASGNGQLFITGKEIQPLYLKFDTATNLLEVSVIDISIRDFEGVRDGLAINERPTTQTNRHEYNLINQGWKDTHIATYLAATGTYPSNTDIWNLAKDTSNNFSASELDKLDLGNTPAPKGRNILNIFHKVRESGDQFFYLDIDHIDSLGYTHRHTRKSTNKWRSWWTTCDITTKTDHNLITGDFVYMSEIPDSYGYFRVGRSGKYTERHKINNMLENRQHKITVLSATKFRVNIGQRWVGQYNDVVYYAQDSLSVGIPYWTGGGVVRVVNRDYSVSSEYLGTAPSDIAFWAGRAWYGGIKDNKYSSFILFSQLLETDENIGKCYQAADPTSEHISDLVATDGGVIPIPEIGELQRFVAVSDSLIVFADNGVWQIKGGESDIFKADDYYIRKVTDVGTSSPESIVQAEGSLFYWSDGGIYSLSADQVTNNLTSTNITEETIQTKYNGFSNAAKLYVKSAYDNSQKKIYWTYNGDNAYTGSTSKHKYDSILILDLSLQAFSIYTIGELDNYSPYVVAPVISAKTTTATISLNVVVNGDQVQVNADNVTTDVDYPARGASKIKLLTAVPQTDDINYAITFSDFNDSTFYDWRTNDEVGVDAVSYIETGFELFSGDAITDKSVDNLYTFFRKTETGFIDDGAGNIIYENPSSCTGYAKWNWSNASASNKETAGFECYKFDRIYIPSGAGDPFIDGTYVVDTKNNIRGSGKSIRFRFESVAGHDCWLLGWTLTGGVNQAPS